MLSCFENIRRFLKVKDTIGLNNFSVQNNSIN